MPPANLKRFFLSIVMPSILAIGLFILSIFVVILPAFENNIMKGKKEMISELTNTVCSLMDEYYEESLENLIPADSARTLALERVRKIRYGEELKDYFWIIDRQPSMLMHPYRPELIRQNLNSYEDSHGKLLFVEALRAVEESEEGFVDYMWQWKDDSSRIVPKLSYVRVFEPWDWIVGTGIYLEDVRLEILTLKKRLLSLALLITLIICALLIFIIRQSLNIERSRRKAEGELGLSKEKYKSLVEASTEGTLMWVNQRFVFSNLKFSDLSGFATDEIAKMGFEDLFILDWKAMEAEITDPKKSVSRECLLRCKDGSSKEVVISASRIKHANQVGYITIVKELSRLMKYEKESAQLTEALQSSLLMLSRPLKSIASQILLCPSTSSIRDAAILLNRKQMDILHIHQQGKIIGVINNHDLVNRALSAGLDPGEAVITIMSAPVQSLPGEATLLEGLLKMSKQGISHISITDHHQKITATVGQREISEMQYDTLEFLLGDVERCFNISKIKAVYQRLPVLVKALVDSGNKTENITRIITSLADAIHQRVISMAIDDLGPPPCKFAFLLMGSLGRGEQTLLTDQDNAIIFEDLPEEKEGKARAYFLTLGKRVNEDLDAVGYRFCQGKIMAGNPKWNQSLKTWKGYFSQWIRNSTPTDILDAAIFFDFRCAYGDCDLVEALRSHVNQAAENRPVFYYHMAHSVIKMKPQSSAAGHGKLDLKLLTLPLSTFIRLYAIREKISENNSLKRARILLERERIDQATYDELTHTLNYITFLRLKGQAYSIARNEAAQNAVDPERLDRLEAVVMKKLLADIAGIQTRLSIEFSGTE